MSRFCHNKGKKRSACHYDKRLDLHQLFEQILYIPLIVFSFLHQPIDTICLVPLLQELGERPIECGLPTLDHAAILLHGIRCFADRQPLGKAFPEESGIVVEHRFERLLGKRKILAHGLSLELTTPQEIDWLKKSSIPGFHQKIVSVNSDEILELDVTLELLEVRLIQITPLH